MDILIDLQYLPCLEYFCCLLKYDQVYLEGHEFYEKQSYRNRCKILSSNKVIELSVPIKKPWRRMAIREMKIENNQNWRKDHCRSIQSAYGNAPFFQFYADSILGIIEKNHRYLWDLNEELLQECLNLMNLKPELDITDQYRRQLNSDLFDLRSKVHPKKSFMNNDFYYPFSYNQIFGNKFVGNLSIIDLLFCEGPESVTILKKSVLKE